MTGEFTFDWFSGNVPNWQKWLCSLVNKPAVALEIGCAEGRATCWLLENVLTHPDSRIFCVDTFVGSEEHAVMELDFSAIKGRWYRNTRKWSDRVVLIEDESCNALRRLRSPVDLVYVDGSHRAADVIQDACLSWLLLRQDGFLLFDDYKWNSENPTHGPKLAIDAFLAIFDGQYELIAKEYQVCLRRTTVNPQIAFMSVPGA